MKEMLEQTRKKMKRKKVSNCISFSNFCFYAFVAALLNDTDAPRGKERERERERGYTRATAWFEHLSI